MHQKYASALCSVWNFEGYLWNSRKQYLYHMIGYFSGCQLDETVSSLGTTTKLHLLFAICMWSWLLTCNLLEIKLYIPYTEKLHFMLSWNSSGFGHFGHFFNVSQHGHNGWLPDNGLVFEQGMLCMLHWINSWHDNSMHTMPEYQYGDA